MEAIARARVEGRPLCPPPPPACPLVTGAFFFPLRLDNALVETEAEEEATSVDSFAREVTGELELAARRAWDRRVVRGGMTR